MLVFGFLLSGGWGNITRERMMSLCIGVHFAKLLSRLLTVILSANIAFGQFSKVDGVKTL